MWGQWKNRFMSHIHVNQAADLAGGIKKHEIQQQNALFLHCLGWQNEP